MNHEQAVEAATKALIKAWGYETTWDEGTAADVRIALEAAAPYMLSHEREQARLAHLDAMVNRDTASRLEQAITGVLELAAPQRHMVRAAEIREWIARALEVDS